MTKRRQGTVVHGAHHTRIVYDWHEAKDHLGIYRTINNNLGLLESDFTQIHPPEGEDPKIHGDLGLRVEFLCNLLNAGIITERQACDAMELMMATMR